MNIYDAAEGGDLIATLSGYNKTTPNVVSMTGVMRVEFSSGNLVDKRGFWANYESFDCPNSCSLHGRCNMGKCVSKESLF